MESKEMYNQKLKYNLKKNKYLKYKIIKKIILNNFD